MPPSSARLPLSEEGWDPQSSGELFQALWEEPLETDSWEQVFLTTEVLLPWSPGIPVNLSATKRDICGTNSKEIHEWKPSLPLLRGCSGLLLLCWALALYFFTHMSVTSLEQTSVLTTFHKFSFVGGGGQAGAGGGSISLWCLCSILLRKEQQSVGWDAMLCVDASCAHPFIKNIPHPTFHKWKLN